MAEGDGGGEAEAFFNACIKIRQFVRRDGIDTLFGLERPTDFCLKLAENLGVLHEVENNARQKGGGRLAASDDKCRKGRVDLRPRHRRDVLVQALHVMHEVGLVYIFAKPLVDLVRGVLMNFEACFLDLGRHVPRGQQPRHREEVQASHVHTGDENPDKYADPVVVFSGFETAEGFAENQLTHDIRGGPSVQLEHVELLLAVADGCADTANEYVDMTLEHAFLCLEGFVRESVVELTPDACMTLPSWRRKDRIRTINAAVKEYRPLLKWPVTWLWCHDIFPCGCLDEAQLVRRDPNDGTVFVMHTLNRLR